ncbi:MAG: class I poly(R)-hydroxyalkanoic acid synthase [Hyphomicrobiaceae bacterium]|nr:MAG: class I poly(R)-hydroxyalkanoic acid synthase [Hyphomicrobiaceae bacterium]
MIALSELYVRRALSGDTYQVIDPRTVMSTFLQVAACAGINPTRFLEEQNAYCIHMLELWQRTAMRLLTHEPVDPVIAPAPDDKRFKGEAWAANPFYDYVKQAYLLSARHLQSVVRNVDGLDPQTARKADFYVRQFLDALAPTNFPATNPDVLHATAKSQGQNLVVGLRNLLEDLERAEGQLLPKVTDLSAFEVGKTLAITPGKIVFQDDLMQLIQYEPVTETVYQRPLLIVPPWINKYYILDLKPANSFIRWAVAQGHTVFVVSWVNPDEGLATKTFTDYMREGPLAALDAIKLATGEDEVNIVGYCIGGTLTASTLAYMAAKGQRTVASATFLTTLLDFADAGEVKVFIDESQLRLLDAHMERMGFLEGRHMAEAFHYLRDRELIWASYINNYLLGRDPPAFDILYWNSDWTHMPAAMHSAYLRDMYQRNLLREPGGIVLDGVPIDLASIRLPAYFLSTREDHIAPWRSTFAGAKLLAGPLRFVVGGSGHVAGVINPPAAKKYGYWAGDDPGEDPDAWLASCTHREGSWWNDWAEWIAMHGGPQVLPHRPGDGLLAPIEDAPGAYARMRIARG